MKNFAKSPINYFQSFFELVKVLANTLSYLVTILTGHLYSIFNSTTLHFAQNSDSRAMQRIRTLELLVYMTMQHHSPLYKYTP